MFGRARIHQWWIKRLPSSDQTNLQHRNIAILPTKTGWMLAITLLVLLLTSINYQLNLGYLITFLLLSCSAASLYFCYGNLNGIQMHIVPVPNCFRNENIPLTIVLHNQRKTTRYGIAMSVSDTTQWAYCDVPAEGSTSIHLGFSAKRRGYHNLPVLLTETRFPIGAFKAFNFWKLSSKVLVYPQPETHPPPLPIAETQSYSAKIKHSIRSNSIEFDGVRPYRRGDSLKQIVWKKAAQSLAVGSDALVSRDNEHKQPTVLWLDYVRNHSVGHEMQLSRLCAWVLQADRLGLEFGLRVPGREIAPGSGAAHRQACLEALALC